MQNLRFERSLMITSTKGLELRPHQRTSNMKSPLRTFIFRSLRHMNMDWMVVRGPRLTQMRPHQRWQTTMSQQGLLLTGEERLHQVDSSPEIWEKQARILVKHTKIGSLIHGCTTPSLKMEKSVISRQTRLPKLCMLSVMRKANSMSYYIRYQITGRTAMSQSSQTSPLL